MSINAFWSDQGTLQAFIQLLKELDQPAGAGGSEVGRNKRRALRPTLDYGLWYEPRCDHSDIAKPHIEFIGYLCLGSRIQGAARSESDLDLAVPVAGYAEPLTLWELAVDLADLAGCPVDLLDFRVASTVMQYQQQT